MGNEIVVRDVLEFHVMGHPKIEIRICCAQKTFILGE